MNTQPAFMRWGQMAILLKDYGISNRKLKVLIAEGVIRKVYPKWVKKGSTTRAYYCTAEVFSRVIDPLISSDKSGPLRATRGQHTKAA